jgi:type IV pilus assembly protein PilV
MKKLNKPRTGKRLAGFKVQRGMTMLEILIAVMVLSVGLLGVAGLQTTNLRNSQSAHQRTMAVLLASGMAERIRANRTVALAGGFTLAKTCAPLSSTSSIQQLEQKTWIDEVRASLGSVATTCGEVTYSAGTRTYTVIVYWDDSKALGGLANMAVRNLVSL